VADRREPYAEIKGGGLKLIKMGVVPNGVFVGGKGEPKRGKTAEPVRKRGGGLGGKTVVGKGPKAPLKGATQVR